MANEQNDEFEPRGAYNCSPPSSSTPCEMTDPCMWKKELSSSQKSSDDSDEDFNGTVIDIPAGKTKYF